MNLNMFNQLFEVPLIRVELSVSKGPTLLPTKLKKYATIFNIYFEFLQEKASRERKRERIMFFLTNLGFNAVNTGLQPMADFFD